MIKNNLGLAQMAIILILFSLTFGVLSITSLASDTKQQRDNRKAPFTIDQIEKEISTKPNNKTNAEIRDENFAGAIQRRGIGFKLDEKVWECLRERLLAWPQTARALEIIRKDKQNALLPGPVGSCDKQKILIADFHCLDNKVEKQYSIGKVILSQLKDELYKYRADTLVESLGKEITVEGGREEARNEAKKRGASILLWGTYSVREREARVTAYFEIIDRWKDLLLKDYELIPGPPDIVDGYKLDFRLSKEMSYLILLISGLSRIEAQDYDEAIKRFTSALEDLKMPEHVTDPWAIYLFRVTAYINKLSHTGRNLIKGNLKADNVTEGLAELLRASNLDKSALEHLLQDCTKLLESSRHRTIAYLCRATAYLFMNEWKLVFDDLASAIQQEPNNALTRQYYALAHHYRGLVYRFNKQLPESIDSFTKAIEFGLKNAQVFNGRGLAYKRAGKQKEAIADFTAAIELDENNERAYFLRGPLFIDAGEWDKAIADFTTLRRIGSKNYLYTYVYTALAYLSKSEWEKAIEDSTKVIEQRQDLEVEQRQEHLILTYTVRATAYLRKGNFDKAIPDCTAVIALDPNNAFAYYLRGQAHEKKGQKDAAVSDLRKVIELSKNDVTMRQGAEDLLKRLR